MARGCSGSDSEEEERHDRFKSERNPTNLVKPLRRNLPSTLEDYSSRPRSPHRPEPSKSRHRNKVSEDRNSIARRDRSRERKRSKDRKFKEHDRNSNDSSEEKRKSYERKSDSERDRYDNGTRKRSRRSDSIELSGKERNKHRERDRRTSYEGDRYDRKELDDQQRNKDEKYSSNSESDNLVTDKIEVEKLSLPRYYEIVDECAADSEGSHHKGSPDEKHKKHKRSREKSQIQDSKKRKKEKKHKRKHEKRKSEEVNKPEVKKEVSLDTSKTQVDCDTNLTTVETISPKMEVDSEHEEGELSASESEQYFGPALPPKRVTEEKVYIPQLAAVEVDQYGPALPPRSTPQDEPEGDLIGPLPAGHQSEAQAALDIRASLLKRQMDNKTTEGETTKREEWMTELPESKRAQLGLGPRKFRTNAAPDMSDRSSWTDTPKDKARKQLMGEETLDTRKLEIAERNKEMEILAKKSEKKEKSLLEMHQKQLKKKKKKEEKERGEKKAERRPFSREVDLQSNRFDEAQKKSIIKKAQLLNSRFSSGESKYL